MSLQEKITTDLKAAMLAKDVQKLNAIRAIKSAILLAQTSGSGTEISEAEELAILQKLAKQRIESIEIYEKQSREDLASEEKIQLAVIQAYLPAQLSDEELNSEIEAIIKSTNATGIKDMGKVMGKANQKLAGKADGKRISAIVKQRLT
jgi:uncharacterized protein YqeY